MAATTKAQELAARLRDMTDDDLAAFARAPRRGDPDVNVNDLLIAEQDRRGAAPHTDAFAGFVAQRDAQRAATVTVSWRKVDAQTGGGYSGLASTGDRVYVVRVERTRVESDTTLWRGTWEYGRMNGPKREFAGNTGTLSRAKLAAEALCGETSTATAAAIPAAADPKKEGNMPRNTPAPATSKTSALDHIVRVLGAAGKVMKVPDILTAVEKASSLHEKTIYGALYSDARKKEGSLVESPAKREFKLSTAGKARYKALTETPTDPKPTTQKPAAATKPAAQPDAPAAAEPAADAPQAAAIEQLGGKGTTAPEAGTRRKVGVQVEAKPDPKKPGRASRAKTPAAA